MKKSILLFLVLTMIFSTLCGVTVSADGTAASITLSRNKTFVKAVDETASLIVTGLDENGVEGAVLPEGTTFTYESSRPWVLDIADNGKFIDGGYDGTTTVTVTASNGMKASAIFIKNSDNIYADTSYQSGDESNTQGDKANIGVGLRFRGTWINELQSICWVRIDKGNVSEADTLAAKIPGENYYKLPAEGATYTTNPGSSIASGYDSVNDNAIAKKQGWYKEGLRVMQGWFYDDGTSDICIGNFMSQHADYLSGENHISWKANVKAAAGAKTYSIDYIYAVKNNTEYPINRSKGWHQVTTILSDDKTIEVFIDGELLSTSTYNNTSSYGHSFLITGASAGNFDEFVVAANPNVTKPEGYAAPAKSITLSRNKTFLTDVDETASLVVTGLDKNGVEGATLPEGTTFTYESSRPWVLDIDDATGKFIDGGYDGTTKVTVTASNGMKASTIFIKNSDNIYANTSYVTAETSDSDTVAAGVGDVGLRFRGTWVNDTYGRCRVNVKADTTSETDKAAAKIPGENYFKMPFTVSNPNPDNAIVSGYDALKKQEAIDKKQSWYKEGLRVMQGWFYDDGTSPVHMRSFMAETSDYLAGAITGLLENGVSHLYWSADINAAEGEDAYSVDFTHEVKKYAENIIKRSKGWHQVTTILNDDMTIDVLVDGELLSSTKSAYNTYVETKFYLTCASAGNYDELVVAANPNTTKPTVNIDVVYDETQGSVLCNNNVVENGGKAEGYYDGSVNFTFEPKEGYELDTVTYDGKEVTAFIKDGVLSVDCKNAELKVTFKEIPVTVPSVSKTMEIKTDQKVDGNPAALMYMQIQPGYGYAVTETGIMLSDSNESAAKGLKLTAMNTDDSKLVSGMFGIRIYGAGVTGKTCWYWPFVTYEKDGQISTEYEDTAESFTLSE